MLNATCFPRQAALPAIGYLLAMATLAGVLGHAMFGVLGAAVAVGVIIGSLALGMRGYNGAQQLQRAGATPLAAWQAPELFEEVAWLARQAGLAQMPRVFAIDARQPNAVTVGTTDTPAIGITLGLLRGLNRRQLLSVLGHEMAHIRNNDIWLAAVASAARRLTALLTTFGLIGVVVALPAMLLGAISVAPSLLLLLMAAPTASALLQLALSRSRELAADRTAASLTGDPAGLASALAQLDRANRSWLSWLRLAPAAAVQPPAADAPADARPYSASPRDGEADLAASSRAGTGAVVDPAHGDAGHPGALAPAPSTGPMCSRTARQKAAASIWPVNNCLIRLCVCVEKALQ